MLASSFEFCFCFASASRHRFPLRNLFGELIHKKIEVRVSRVYLTMDNCSACDECETRPLGVNADLRLRSLCNSSDQ